MSAWCRVLGGIMPFPFVPVGIVLAAAVLSVAYAIFATVLRVLDRAALTVRNSIAPGVVAGLRTWSQHQPEVRRVSSQAGTDTGLGPFPPLATAEARHGAATNATAALGESGESAGEIVDLNEPTDVPLAAVQMR